MTEGEVEDDYTETRRAFGQPPETEAIERIVNEIWESTIPDWIAEVRAAHDRETEAKLAPEKFEHTKERRAMRRAAKSALKAKCRAEAGEECIDEGSQQLCQH